MLVAVDRHADQRGEGEDGPNKDRGRQRRGRGRRAGPQRDQDDRHRHCGRHRQQTVDAPGHRPGRDDGERRTQRLRDPAPRKPTAAARASQASPARRQARCEEAARLRADGVSISRIAVLPGAERQTVRRWLRPGRAPSWAKPRRGGVLDAYLRRDLAVVQAALGTPWTTSPAEGRITREVVLVIHRKSGQHSQLRVRKPRMGEHGCQTPDDALAVMRSMAGRWDDGQIAASLNRMGLQTGQGKTWTAHRVGSLRRVHDIHACRSAEKGGEWLTMSEAAAALGVSHHVIRRLIRDKLLAAEQVVPYQVRVSDLQADQVTAALKRRTRPCHSEQQNQLPILTDA